MTKIQPYRPNSNKGVLESLIESAMINQYVSARRNRSHDVQNISQQTTNHSTAKFIRSQRRIFPTSIENGRSPATDEVITRSDPIKKNNPKYLYIETREPTQLPCCPNCGRDHITTHTHTKATGRTWAVVVLSAVIFWPLAWVPLAATLFKQTNHYCQHCAAKIGRVKPLDGCHCS